MFTIDYIMLLRQHRTKYLYVSGVDCTKGGQHYPRIVIIQLPLNDEKSNETRDFELARDKKLL